LKLPEYFELLNKARERQQEAMSMNTKATHITEGHKHIEELTYWIACVVKEKYHKTDSV